MASRLFTVVLLVTFLSASAQPGIKDSIFSQIIGEERALQVQLPKEYKPGAGERYPVLYLLDGEWNAELFQQAQAWLRQWGFTPPIIMVGVANSYLKGENQRFRDLTPTAGGQAGAGGGPKLLSFLKNELVPYINKTYPSSGSNILWGHSLGGLFVLYALATEPDLFDGYIAADPSIWWDNKFLLHYSIGRLSDIKRIKSLLITGRTGAAYHGMGIDSFELFLQRNAPPELQWRTVSYPDETHVSQQGKSAYDGLKYTFAPLFQLDRIHVDPLGGVVVKGEPFTLQCSNIMAEKYLRYTVDGSDPTLKAAKVDVLTPVTPGGDLKLTLKAFFSGDSADKRLVLSFPAGGWVKPAGKPKEAVGGGWSYATHRQGAGDPVIKTGVFADGVNQNALDTVDYACTLGGWLEVKEKGYYVFEMAGGPGAKLFIGDRQLMEIAAGTDYNSFMIPLEKGAHAVRFEFTHKKGGGDFGFSYELPGQAYDDAIPVALMYHLPQKQ